MLGNYFDLPPAQTIIALMSFMLLLTWSYRWTRDSFFVSFIENRVLFKTVTYAESTKTISDSVYPRRTQRGCLTITSIALDQPDDGSSRCQCGLGCARFWLFLSWPLCRGGSDGMENIQCEASLALARVCRICSGTDVLAHFVAVLLD